jgi:hypothetical protein
MGIKCIQHDDSHENSLLTAYKQHPNSTIECRYHASGSCSNSNANIADCSIAMKSIQADEHKWSGTLAEIGTCLKI